MINSSDHRVVALPARGLLRGQRVGVCAAVPAGPALLTVHAPDGPRSRGVLVEAVPEVPPGVLAVGGDLRDDLSLAEDARWSLDRAPVVDADRIVVELSTERSPEAVAAQIAAAGLLGTVLWVPARGRPGLLDIADVPYRVLSVDTGTGGDVLARIGPRTTVELFAPGVKAGVDMVILADCSGSMDVDDIPVPAESVLALRGQRFIRRMDALQHALRDLLDVRLQVAGRVSRVALLAFTSTAECRFPRGGGMAQLDAGSPPEVIDQFRQAVTLLRPGGRTLIGNALHAAADLLYQHGHPGNERLVVLVSDGADWKPKGDQSTGEIMDATSEPIGLMEHLHRDMRIRLHAIGISTRELYLRRYQQPRETLTPDHDLLEELVKVGGGDPTTIGGLDVLVEYFSGVGGGITHRVRQTLSAPPPTALDEQARTLLLDAARVDGDSPATERYEALEELGTTITRIDRASERVFSTLLIPAHRVGDAMRLLREGVTAGSLPDTLRRVLRLLRPVIPEREYPQTVADYARLLDALTGRLVADPPDLDGLAAGCGATGTGPGELLAAVVHRLSAALSDILVEADRLPGYRPDPPDAGAPAGVTDDRGAALATVGFVLRD